ncbi:hypothetical protein GCM10023215_12830 [Pseudonocardia yuanmonensis]|uniref:Lipoprotein n=1 Tax=Pseudonocardia yuanmonensis TaxID=1095914 RepID=A0ABP8W6Z1_9PSEU
MRRLAAARGGPIRVASALPVALVAPLLLAGCGTVSSGAETVARQFVDASAAGDVRTECALLAPATRDTLEHQRGGPCETELGPLALPRGTVVGAEEWSDRAQVRTTADTLFLTRTSEGWRIAAAGCVPRGEAPYVCTVEGP